MEEQCDQPTTSFMLPLLVPLSLIAMAANARILSASRRRRPCAGLCHPAACLLLRIAREEPRASGDVSRRAPTRREGDDLMAVQVLSWGAVEPDRDLPHLISRFTEQVGPPPPVAACVALPARDEAATLPAALRALAAQVNAGGLPLESSGYEVVVLLNNCRDRSKDAALSAASPRLSMTLVDLECCHRPACMSAGRGVWPWTSRRPGCAPREAKVSS